MKDTKNFLAIFNVGLPKVMYQDYEPFLSECLTNIFADPTIKASVSRKNIHVY